MVTSKRVRGLIEWFENPEHDVGDEERQNLLLDLHEIHTLLDDERKTREAQCVGLAWCEAEIDRLRNALDESVRLQSHYAQLLNTYDDGQPAGRAATAGTRSTVTAASVARAAARALPRSPRRS